MLKRLLIGVLALAASACGFGESTEAAEREVERFHRLLDEERYDSIYATTNDELRRDADEAQFTDLLRRARAAFGDIRRAERQGWQVNYVNGETRVALSYQTEGANGRGTEEFVWVLREGRDPELAGYTVNARADGGADDTARGRGGEEDRGSGEERR
jgi:hypothetical protein